MFRFIVFLSLFSICVDAVSDIGVIYSRVPRAQGPVEWTMNNSGAVISVAHPDLFDQLPDTQNQLQGITAPGQLVFFDGTQNRMLFDCDDCIPLDVALNSDRTRAVFAVIYGTVKDRLYKGALTNLRGLADPTRTEIWEVEIATGELRQIVPQPIPGQVIQNHDSVYHLGPIYIENDSKILFTSTLAGIYPTVVRNATPHPFPTLQLWAMNLDGSGAVNLSPQEIDGVLNPYLLSSGRVIFSTWQLGHNLPYRFTNGRPNGLATLHNLFWIASVDEQGRDWRSLLGAHSPQGGIGVRALHFVGERENGEICAANYYRGNNNGAGNILCWRPEPIHIEGISIEQAVDQSEVFVPRTLYNATEWANSLDTSSVFDGMRYLGKARDPEGIPDGQLMLTYLRGPCSSFFGSIAVAQASISNASLGCDAGIYMTTQIPSESPDDLVKIVDSPDWHEFAGRYVPVSTAAVPDEPAVSQTDCTLGSANMFDAETHHKGGYSFGNYQSCGLQGCEIAGLPPIEMAAIRFWRVVPPMKASKNHLNTLIGYKIEPLGDVVPNNDGSFLASLPCDVPYLMAGVDVNGFAVKRDQVPQSLRPGEQRICSGCHNHSDEGTDFTKTLAASAAPSELIPSPVVPAYQTDIWPILERACADCHAGPEAPAGLDLSIPGTGPGSTHHRLVWDYTQSYVAPAARIYSQPNPSDARLDRPNSSKYVNSVFARESLLLWKAANARLDGRTDTQYPNDIDFGDDHPTSATEEDIKVIGHWIDTGAFAE